MIHRNALGALLTFLAKQAAGRDQISLQAPHVHPRQSLQGLEPCQQHLMVGHTCLTFRSKSRTLSHHISRDPTETGHPAKDQLCHSLSEPDWLHSQGHSIARMEMELATNECGAILAQGADSQTPQGKGEGYLPACLAGLPAFSVLLLGTAGSTSLCLINCPL